MNKTAFRLIVKRELVVPNAQQTMRKSDTRLGYTRATKKKQETVATAEPTHCAAVNYPGAYPENRDGCGWQVFSICAHETESASISKGH